MIAAQVKRTLRERELVEPGDHVLVACSGGPDSTALLHVLHRVGVEVGITVCAASIDHGLRPESADEVQRVSAFARSLSVPFRSLRITIPKEGASLQGRARTLRYEALAELAAESKATKVAVGHTQDDQAETVLARILRGAGLHGLGGIEPRREDGVIRPLFDCRRGDVLVYLDAQGVSYLEDPSNHQRSFERVRIRHEVMPLLVREDPRVVDHLCALGDEAAELGEALDAGLPELPEPGERSLAIAGVARLSPPVRVRWLRLWLTRETGFSPGRSHLSAIGQLLTAAGEVLLGSGWAVRREGERLLLEYREHRRTRSNRS